MSDHPLDFLKDYDVKQEVHDSAAVPAGSAVPDVPTGEKPAENNVSKSDPPSGKKKRRKRMEITKKEAARKEIRERRKQERQVVDEKCNCHWSCSTKITDERRKAINERYWNMGHIEQRQFVKSHSVPGKVKRRRVPLDPLGGSEGAAKKAFTYSFYLHDHNEELQTVCCTFFLNTLGFRKGCGNHIYRTHMRGNILEDKRGKYTRDTSLHDAMWDDILSYSPRTYHKGLKYSATALYLPSKLNAKMMHMDFKERRSAVGEKPGSVGFYCAILREMDVHFVEMDDFQLPERKPIVVVPPPPPVPVDTLIVEQEPPAVETVADETHSVHSYEQLPPVPVMGSDDQESPFPHYPIEYKPVVSNYTDISHHTNLPVYQTDDVKKEPYYGMHSEHLVTHYTTDNDDYSDSYSNMVIEPDYSESSYHGTHSITEDTIEETTDHQHPSPAEYEECMRPAEAHPSTSYSIPDHETPTKSTSEMPPPPPSKKRKKAAPKVKIDPTALPEGYPPVKRTKKVMARILHHEKRRQSHPVLRLDCNCVWTCKDKIGFEQQDNINAKYWSMGFCDQRMFMLEHTERHSVKRRRAKVMDDNAQKRKGYTYSYRLTDSKGGYQPVCCQFFLNTLGFGVGSGNVIYRAHREELGVAISDKRGKFTRDTTMRDNMDDDILSYFTPEQQESGVLDLSSTDWAAKKMFNRYLERQTELGNDKPGSFGFYWRRLKEMKVQFFYHNKPESKTPKAPSKPRSRSKPKPKAQYPTDCQEQQPTATAMEYPQGFNVAQ